jgi:hypothetical protein
MCDCIQDITHNTSNHRARTEDKEKGEEMTQSSNIDLLRAMFNEKEEEAIIDMMIELTGKKRYKDTAWMFLKKLESLPE